MIGRMLVALFGAAIVFGWAEWAGWLIDLNGEQPTMQVSTALVFLAAGISLAAATRKRNLLSSGLGLTVALLSTIAIVEYLANVDLATNANLLPALGPASAPLAGHTAPAAAIAFAFAATALLVAPGARFETGREYLAALLGTAEASIGAVALLYLMGGLPAQLSEMAVSTAFGHVLLGAGMVSQVFSRPPATPAEKLRRTGSLVVVMLTTISVMLWSGINRFSEDQLTRHLKTQIRGMGNHIEATLQERALVVERLAQRWETELGTPREAWNRDVETYLAHMPSLLSLQWVDASGRVRWVQPEAGNEAVIGLDNAKDPVRSKLLERARGRNVGVFSSEIALRQGGQGLLLMRALKVRGQLDGYLVAVFRTNDLFADLTADIPASEYGVEISLDGHTLYRRDTTFATAEALALAQTFAFHAGGAWRLNVWPTSSATARTALPELLLGSGIAQALLAGFAFWFWAQSQQRTQLAREASEALRRERNFVTSLLDNSNALCVVLDRDGHILRFNQACQDLFGYRADEVQGKPFWDYLLGENEIPTEARQAFSRWIDSQRPVRSEKTWKGKDGGRHLIAWSSTVMADASGRAAFACAIGVDITRRREIEQALIAAKNDAEAANRAKSQFLSSMSHELRTPMNAVLGFAQLMDMDANLPAEHRESIEQIIGAGSHLLKLINDVLSLAKIEAGNSDPDFEAVDCHALIRECVAMVGPLARKQNIRLSADAAENTHAHTDRRLLKQILLNLLSNGIKYNRPGGAVSVEATISKSGNSVVLGVTDTGHGIPEARLSELFQPFNRLGAETRSIEGSGIGLAVCKRLVDALGGRISVSSQPNAGSTFQVTLPTCVEARTAQSTTPEEATSPAHPQSLSTGRA